MGDEPQSANSEVHDDRLTTLFRQLRFHTGCCTGCCTTILYTAGPSPDAKRAQKTAVAGAGGLLGVRVVRLEERVPGAEAVSVEVSLDDQGRLFLLEGVAHLAEEAATPRFGRFSEHKEGQTRWPVRGAGRGGAGRELGLHPLGTFASRAAIRPSNSFLSHGPCPSLL